MSSMLTSSGHEWEISNAPQGATQDAGWSTGPGRIADLLAGEPSHLGCWPLEAYRTQAQKAASDSDFDRIMPGGVFNPWMLQVADNMYETLPTVQESVPPSSHTLASAEPMSSQAAEPISSQAADPGVHDSVNNAMKKTKRGKKKASTRASSSAAPQRTDRSSISEGGQTDLLFSIKASMTDLERLAGQGQTMVLWAEKRGALVSRHRDALPELLNDLSTATITARRLHGMLSFDIRRENLLRECPKVSETMCRTGFSSHQHGRGNHSLCIMDYVHRGEATLAALRKLTIDADQWETRGWQRTTELSELAKTAFIKLRLEDYHSDPDALLTKCETKASELKRMLQRHRDRVAEDELTAPGLGLAGGICKMTRNKTCASEHCDDKTCTTIMSMALEDAAKEMVFAEKVARALREELEDSA